MSNHIPGSGAAFGLVTTAVLTLCACGGGGEAAMSPVLVTGTAATGLAISGGDVVLKCVTGTFKAMAPTAADGSFTVDVSTATLPCVARLIYTESGSVAPNQLHSLVDAPGHVNITPITDLVVAKLNGTENAGDAYDKLDASTLRTHSADRQAQAMAAVKTYLEVQGVNTTGLQADVLHDKFTPQTAAGAGDAADNVLDALRLRLANTTLVAMARGLLKADAPAPSPAAIPAAPVPAPSPTEPAPSAPAPAPTTAPTTPSPAPTPPAPTPPAPTPAPPAPAPAPVAAIFAATVNWNACLTPPTKSQDGYWLSTDCHIGAITFVNFDKLADADDGQNIRSTSPYAVNGWSTDPANDSIGVVLHTGLHGVVDTPTVLNNTYVGLGTTETLDCSIRRTGLGMAILLTGSRSGYRIQNQTSMLISPRQNTVRIEADSLGLIRYWEIPAWGSSPLKSMTFGSSGLVRVIDGMLQCS